MSMYELNFIEEVTKDLRSKGKVATLSLGYQGGVEALYNMGFEGTEVEAEEIKRKYRDANPNIVDLWRDVDTSVKKCIKEGGMYTYRKPFKLKIGRDNKFLKIMLPSGRVLRYYKPFIMEADRRKIIAYWGVNSITKKFSIIQTFGGRL